MQSIPKDTFVEFRILTEPSIFNIQQLSGKKYESILNEEKINFQTYNITHSIILYIIFVIIIPVIIFFYFYLKYGREPKVDYDLKYEQEPPRDVPPMALSNIYVDLKNSTRGLLATILDLARRGYIDIREEKKERFMAFDKTEQIFKITFKGKKALKSKTELLNFEKVVLSLLFEDMTEKNEISSSEMAKWCRNHKGDMLEKTKKIEDDAKTWFEKKYFKIYEPKSMKQAERFMIFMIPYFILILIFLFFIGALPQGLNLLVLAFVFTVLILAVATHAINRRTPEAALEIKKWNAFKNYISDFSAMKDAPTTLLHIWDRYLIYAVVLGVAKQLLENIKDLSIERHAPVAAVVWYHPIGVAGVPKGMMSPEAFTALSSNMNSMISALSSSSSVGGGFSGGGGGGGGGGGSGAG